MIITPPQKGYVCYPNNWSIITAKIIKAQNEQKKSITNESKNTQ